LHEFYGILAFHYGRAEYEEKTAEYLVKAGEAALKSSASTEALVYYQKALHLYTNKYGEASDPSFVATLEKNIALALYNKGQYLEAIEYFDRVLLYYGENVPKNSILVLSRFLSCFVSFLISLYFPFLKFKKTPTQKDNEIIEVTSKKIEALIVIDAKRMFIEYFYLLKKLAEFDLTKVESGVSFFASASTIFSRSGISFKLSRKMLDLCRKKVKRDDARSVLIYELVELIHNYLVGDWGAANEYDDSLVKKNLSTGELFFVSAYLFFHGSMACYRGYFDEARKKVVKLSEIAETYEHDIAKVFKHHLNIELLVGYRRLHDAVKESDAVIAFCVNKGMKQYIYTDYAQKARAQMILRDMKGAEDSLRCAREYQSEIMAIPFHRCLLLISEFAFYLWRLEELRKIGKNGELGRTRKRVLKIGIEAVQISRKVANNQTEALRLMGMYYWLIGKQKKGFKWFSRSIKNGQRIGDRLELSRTYMEVGRRLLDRGSIYKELDGIKAEGYLEKARSMFQEMGLKWDLDEMDKIAI
jgi:tetratricopeptide (TPR) repeat protein